MTKPIGRGRNPVARPVPRNNTRWREVFLGKLAETSNVTAAAEWAHISTAQVYASRRGEPEFARKWMNALCEGYDLLELELLSRLRIGESKEEPSRKFDNATALRLLTAHRATVARERALRDNRSEQAVLDSIDEFIDRMRERSASNELLLAEPVLDSSDDEA
ncbi:MAG: hypothetical protein ABIW31_05145 [Novosphingobium sp.]